MGLESVTFISDLVSTNPVSTDLKSAGDDHIRRIKAALLNTFPLVTGAVSATHMEINALVGVTDFVQDQIDDLVAADAYLTTTKVSYSDLSTTPLAIIYGGTGAATAPAARTALGAAADASLQTLWIPAVAMTPALTSGASFEVYESTNRKRVFKTLSFADGSDKAAQFFVQMPKGWDEGTITAKFHYYASATGDITWALQAAAIETTRDELWGTAQVITDTIGGSNIPYVTDATPAITIGNTPTAEALVSFNVYRDGDAGSDTCAGIGYLIGVAIQYSTTSLSDA